MHENHIGCNWLKPALVPEYRKKIVKNCVKIAKECIGLDNFDTIAFMGTSGALIAPLVADKLNKNLALCRKSGENRHSGYSYEGPETVNNYIIIDDLTASGTTIRNIIDKIKNREYSKGNNLCYSIIFYHAQSLGGQSPVLFPPVEEKRAFNTLIIPTFSFRLLD